MWEHLRNNRVWQGELQNRRKDGSLFWEKTYIAPVLDSDGSVQHLIGLKEDITLQKQQEAEILRQAHYDSLTALPNRFLSLDRLSQALKEAQRKNHRVAVLFLDLDDFKKVNDTLGHDIGDQLLIEAANRLRKGLRDEDTVGRLGGDEFIVIAGSLNEATDARSIAEVLLTQFHEAFRVQQRELLITASIGIACFPDDGNTPTELLRNADTAMYKSKEIGRNTYQFYTDSLNERVARRLAIEEQMHGALERNEFAVVYQPLLDIESHRIVGAEALLRWKNQALGDLSPTEFIPVSEQTGMILNQGYFVLGEAVRVLRRLCDEFDHPFRISVNVSPRQFFDQQLPEKVRLLLERNRLAGDQVQLEITEGVLMSGHVDVENALLRLRKLGLRLAIDDFGTGYSSLSYLRRFHFDTLKIDRSFVRDIETDPADRELIMATIAMAHGLGLVTVAEGVETEQQLAYLRERGCDIAQGYLVGKPMPEQALLDLLHHPGAAE